MSSYELPLSRAPGISVHEHSEALLWPFEFQHTAEKKHKRAWLRSVHLQRERTGGVDHAIHARFQREGMGGKAGSRATAGVMPSLGWTPAGEQRVAEARPMLRWTILKFAMCPLPAQREVGSLGDSLSTKTDSSDQ